MGNIVSQGIANERNRKSDQQCFYTVIDKSIAKITDAIIANIKDPCVQQISWSEVKESSGDGICRLVAFQQGSSMPTRGEDIPWNKRQQLSKVKRVTVVCICKYDQKEHSSHCYGSDPYIEEQDELIEYHVFTNGNPHDCSLDKQRKLISLITGQTSKTDNNILKPSDVRKKWRQNGYEHWNQEAVLKIRGEFTTMVNNLKTTEGIQIILCGRTGEGKSSLINNLLAAAKGQFAVVADSGGGSHQVTKRYKQHPISMEEQDRMTKTNLSFFDTRGFSESLKHGASVAAIQACIMGRVANEEEIDPEKTDEEWRHRDAKETKASYIFFVVNAMYVPDDGNMDTFKSHKTTYENLQQIRTFSIAENIRVAAFLTNCDTLDCEVATDVGNLYYSEKVKKKVEAFSKMIDVPKIRTYQIVNYANDTDVTDSMAMQTLIPLKHCLQDIWSNYIS